MTSLVWKESLYSAGNPVFARVLVAWDRGGKYLLSELRTSDGDDWFLSYRPSHGVPVVIVGDGDGGTHTTREAAMAAARQHAGWSHD